MQGPDSRARKLPRRLKRFSILRLFLLLTIYGVFAAAAAAYYVISEISKELPKDLGAALDYRPNQASRVYSSNGELIGEFYLQKRILVLPERIPAHVRNAFISAEDRRFWEHPGFDTLGILRAAYTNYQSGSTRQGASTITQQVTRMLLLSNERTYERKIKELILSVRVERELSKAEILHLYLNHAYLGQGAYGVAAGAEVYFGKSVEHLTVAEAALLAGLVQAPSRYAPTRNMDAARARQRYVLDRMQADGYLTAAERTQALAEPLALVDSDRPLNHVAAPYFVEHVRRWATRRFDPHDVLHGGLHIHTTLDTRLQNAADSALRAGLVSLDRRIGFRGPIGHLEESDLAGLAGSPPRPYTGGLADLAQSSSHELLADVAYIGAIKRLPGQSGVLVNLGPMDLPMEQSDATQMRRWRGTVASRTGAPADQQPAQERTLAVGDLVPVAVIFDAEGPSRVQLAQAPDVQGALVSIEPGTGRIVAMVGGYDYRQSQFNRATQARRQIGSAIKPFIYALALDGGMTHLDQVVDKPVAVHTAAGVWTPSNYDNRYRGVVTVRTALAKSLNTVSVRLLLRFGVDRLIAMLHTVGIQSNIPDHISIALGTPDLTLLEVSGAYGTFASGGKRVEPRFIDWVADGDGRILVDQRQERPTEQVISPQLAYLTTELMSAVVRRGTGRAAQALDRPAAGKTGTSTEYRDAWFIGFTADLICGVWVGRDDFTPIGARATGGSAALPIWVSFMEAAHADTPPHPFVPPEDIWFVRADQTTGWLAPPGSARAEWVPMARGTIPARLGARALPFEEVRYSPFRVRP